MNTKRGHTTTLSELPLAIEDLLIDPQKGMIIHKENSDVDGGSENKTRPALERQ